MKFLILTLIMIFAVSVAYAAPVGNPATPVMLKSGLLTKEEESQFGFVIGPEFDFVNDRNIKNQVGDTKVRFYGGKAGVVIADRAFVYGILGACQIEQEFTVLGSKVEWETETEFAWGVGTTVLLYETTIDLMGNGILRLGVDGKFRYSNPDVEEITIDGTVYKLSDAGVSNVNLELKEWQVALGISYQIDRFLPYIGVKYSDVDGEAKGTYSGTTYKENLKADDNIGIFVGTDILITDSMSVNVEGRFIDEQALTVGALIRF